MNTQIANWKLEPLLQKILSELRGDQQLNSLTRLKLTKLRRALAGPYMDYSETLPDLLDAHVQKTAGGHYKTKPGPSGEEYVFTTEDDEQAFTDVSEALNPIEVPMPLTPADLNEFTTNALQFELFMLFVEGEQLSTQNKKGE